ncbi:RagB/SusD family nutrient uptake outer membrane protein [Flavivirga jejuensis]|uniref:RagB/SusD family nutrient uptake outer membrane protein n=1 Tax=Flavivirga jejuensis TaxID=870487 RepID=A0ABT8WR28_9FLAO|nr:RagB/SusD family nutrient uptake outer membrane protein [Flavivirga jejuensis]MDO5975619.1 RagB/SusD family nutrient uptake outer membrane protein [Flavivirga jejuensis]
MKNIIYTALITLVFGASSCSSDNFLDREPDFILTEGNTITTPTEARTAVNGIYAVREDASGGWSAGHYTSKASQSGFIDWNEGDFEMSSTQTNPTSVGEFYWIDFYGIVNAANFAIKGITDLGSDVFDGVEEYNALLAEARCWRAWAHMNIFWNFGHWFSDDDINPYGVLYREEVADLDNLEQARLNVGESYAKIFEDLDFAIMHLNNFTDNRFLSKEFAKIIKAKALLRRGGFNDNIDQLNESLALVNDVLNNPPAGFAMQEDLAEVYQDSWDSEENLFVGFLDGDGETSDDIPFEYEFEIPVRFGQEINPFDPIPADELTAGLRFGDDLFRADPRWSIVTGESFFETYTWIKLTRFSPTIGQFDLKFNTYYFRFPELYIMRSELLARTGASIAEAIAPINTMRSIRTNPVLPSLNPTTQQELMDAIFFEYIFETFLENGNEFYAALRFDAPNGDPWIETIKASAGIPLVINSIPYPIPNAEIFGNQLMIQNEDLE